MDSEFFDVVVKPSGDSPLSRDQLKPVLQQVAQGIDFISSRNSEPSNDQTHFSGFPFASKLLKAQADARALEEQ